MAWSAVIWREFNFRWKSDPRTHGRQTKHTVVCTKVDSRKWVKTYAIIGFFQKSVFFKLIFFSFQEIGFWLFRFLGAIVWWFHWQQARPLIELIEGNRFIYFLSYSKHPRNFKIQKNPLSKKSTLVFFDVCFYQRWKKPKLPWVKTTFMSQPSCKPQYINKNK